MAAEVREAIRHGASASACASRDDETASGVEDMLLPVDRHGALARNTDKEDLYLVVDVLGHPVACRKDDEVHAQLLALERPWHFQPGAGLRQPSEICNRHILGDGS